MRNDWSRSLTGIATAFLLAAGAVALAQTPPKTAPAPTTKTTNPNVVKVKPTGSDGPAEPAGVYGYIAFTDPTTGKRYLGLDTSVTPPAQKGGPVTCVVVFKSKRGLADVKVEYPSCQRMQQSTIEQAGKEPVAVPYAVQFLHDTSIEGPPARADQPSARIRYNPQQWSFDHVEIGPWRTFRPSADGKTQTVDLEIPLKPRATPWTDLDNTPVFQ
jgi:hypothetical protein